MLTFICKEEKGIVVEAMVLGDKPDGELYGDESTLTIDNNTCMDLLDINRSEEYAEDEDGDEYEYEQINVTMPLNKIVKNKGKLHVTPYFFRDFGNVFLTDDFKHIRLATTWPQLLKKVANCFNFL